jgi:S-adenosylmethionine-diacylgycerolhomoserine-N-methlytransferase
LPVTAGAHVVELGGGTGRNVEYFGERLAGFARVDIVDLCEPLIAIARERFSTRSNVVCTLADATRWSPSGPVDAVYLSYALTMIPNWRVVIDNAIRMLAPGGVIGVVDFHVGPHHGWLTRFIWPRWFAHDGVYLSPDHVPYLGARVDIIECEEHRAPVPYLAGAAVPYYHLIGRKRL